VNRNGCVHVNGYDCRHLSGVDDCGRENSLLIRQYSAFWHGNVRASVLIGFFRSCGYGCAVIMRSCIMSH